MSLTYNRQAMNRTLVSETVNHIGETVLLKGWVDARRDHGKIVFLDIRDRSGIVQSVLLESEKAKDVRSEFVVEVTGKINKRPDHMVNPHIPTGTVEVTIESIVVINSSETPPFPLDTDGYAIDEEIRLKYRYLDLRSSRMYQNIKI